MIQKAETDFLTCREGDHLAFVIIKHNANAHGKIRNLFIADIFAEHFYRPGIAAAIVGRHNPRHGPAESRLAGAAGSCDGRKGTFFNGKIDILQKNIALGIA